MIVARCHRVDPVAAAQRDRRALGLGLPDPVDQEFLEPGLLQVDEGRKAVAILGRRLNSKTFRSS